MRSDAGARTLLLALLVSLEFALPPLLRPAADRAAGALASPAPDGATGSRADEEQVASHLGTGGIRGIQIVAALLAWRFLLRRGADGIGIDPRVWRIEARRAIPLAAAAFGAGWLVLAAAGHLRWIPPTAAPLSPDAPGTAWGAVLAARLALGPLAEEIAFRALLQEGVRARLGPVPAILFSTALFAAAHLGTGGGAAALLYPAVGGLLFGAAFEITGSLLTPWLLHAAGNAALLAAT